MTAGLDVTVDLNEIPDVPAGIGWIGVEVTVICGPVVGEVVVTVDSTGEVVREAMIDLDGGATGSAAGLARIVTDDPWVLRRLAVVSTILADHLTG